MSILKKFPNPVKESPPDSSPSQPCASSLEEFHAAGPANAEASSIHHALVYENYLREQARQCRTRIIRPFQTGRAITSRRVVA